MEELGAALDPDLAVPPLDPPDPHRGFEHHRVGRALVSLFVALTVTAMVFEVLPASVAPPDAVRRATGQYVKAVGLYQPWAVFSPPRNEVLALEATVTFDDGSTTTWTPPVRNDLVGSYSDYHWQKYAEHAALRGNSDEWPRLWEPLARYVARDATLDGRQPVSVQLTTRRSTNFSLADGAGRDVERVDDYFFLDLEAER